MKNQTIYEEVSRGFNRKLAFLENIMVAVCDFTDGPTENPDPKHSHPHEQITYVAEGEVFFFMGEEKFHLKKGDVITIPSGVPHSIQKLCNKIILVDCFSPVRKDFLQK
ncbi:MAG TPA: cupin domain-containing protein [Bacteroidales bacterium]|nr:cupin domain-containing protein [Bacteroidales bacterium]